MPWWLLYLIQAVFFVVGELLRPTPDFEDAQATPFGEVNLPLSDPSRKQAIIWGRVDIRSPHVMDVTEYTTVPIQKKQKVSIFKSVKVTIGHRYFIGMQLGICAKADTLHTIYFDDRELVLLTLNHDDDGVSNTLSAPDFFGGREEGGGVIGTFRFYGGSITQNVSAYLASFQTPTPAYRWTSFLQMENVEVGEVPNIVNIAVQVSRYPNPLGLAASTAQYEGNDTPFFDLINPMSIMYEVLTDDDYGFNMDPGEIDSTSFSTAATTLKNEKNGMCLKWTRNQTIDKLIDQINKQVDGSLRYDPSAGKWGYKLLRNDYSIPGLKTFDETNITSLENYSRANWDETINQIEIKYTQAGQIDPPPPAMAENRSNYIRLESKQKIASLTMPGVYSSALANEIASRELFTLGVPLAKADFKCNREAFDLLPGDPFVFAWPELGITQIVMRIVDLGYGDDEFQEMQIVAVQDVFAIRDTIFATPPATFFTSPGGAPIDIPAADQFVAEQTFLMNLESDIPTVPGSTNQSYGAARQPQGNAKYFNFYQRQGSDPYTFQFQGDYVPKGVLNVAIAEDAGGENDIIATVQVDSVTTALLDATAVTPANIKLGRTNICIVTATGEEPEFIAYESLTIVGNTVTMNNVHRGLWDSLPVPWASADRVFFLRGLEIPGPVSSEEEYGATDVVDFQMENVNSEGPASIGTTHVLTFRNRVARPYGGGFFRVEALRYPQVPFAAGSDLEASWRHRDKLTDPFKFQGDASDAAVETGFEYELEIYDDTGSTLLRTIRPSGSSVLPAGDDTFTTEDSNGATYDYTFTKQGADNGPFALTRFELRVVENIATPTIQTLVDVIRVVQVIVPISLTARGPAYTSILLEGANLYQPFNEEAGPPYEATVGAGADGTDVGTVGHGAPGPDPLTFSLITIGVDNNAAEIPDGTGSDITNVFAIGFWFRMVKDAQTLDRQIFLKATTSTRAYSMALDEFGTFITQVNNTAAIDEALAGMGHEFDDGRWHYCWFQLDSVTANTRILLVDGSLMLRTADSFSVINNAQAFRVGAGDGQLGFAKQGFALFGLQAAVLGPADYARVAVDSEMMYTFTRKTLGMSTKLYLRGNQGQISNQQNFTDFAEDATFNEADWVGSAGGAGTFSSQNNVVAASRLLAGHVLDGSLSLSFKNPANNFLSGPDNWLNVNDTTDGPQEFLFWCIFEVDILPADVDLFRAGQTTDVEFYEIRIATDGDVEIFVQPSSGNNRLHETTDQPIAIDTPYEIVVTNSATTGFACWINGVEHTLTNTTVNGTPPNVDQFMENRGGTSTMHYDFWNNPGTVKDFVGDITAWGWSETRWTDDEIVLHYASWQRGFQDFTDVLLDDNPENLFRVDDNAVEDLRGGIVGSPTATGTFVTAEEVPMAWDDSNLPQRFDGTNDLAYTTQLLDSLGTGVLQDFSLLFVGQVMDISADVTLFANFNTADAVTDTNLRIIYDQSLAGLAFESLNGGVNIAGPLVGDTDAFCIGLIETDAGTDEWDWWKEAKRDSQVTTNNVYGGAASDEFRIGARGTQDQDLDGNPQFIVAWARSIDPRIMRRVQLAYRGFRGEMLEIHKHIDNNGAFSQVGFMFPLDERDPGASSFENWVINDSGVQNLAEQGASTISRGVVSEGLFRFTTFGSGIYAETTAPAIADASYPLTVGGWFRADTGADDAQMAFSNSTETDEYIAVGIRDGNPAINLGLGAADVEEASSVTVTQGDFVHIVVRFISDTVRRLYINGVFDTEFTTSRDVDGILTSFDRFAVNRIIGPDTDFAGSYQLVWGVQATLTDTDVLKIYSAGRPPAWEQVSFEDAPVAQWLLGEYVDSLTDTRFRDRFNDDYNAIGTGLAHGALGLIPNRKDLCVDFDGTGNIDTNFSGYQTGAGARTFECWIEQGYTGTVYSMGADTDAQALVVSVDGSGDVSIHIRGAGNERIWTTALDTGGDHHLVILLPAAGDSLHDFDIYIDGVEETTIGTAGTDTTLNTTATFDFTIGFDITSVGKAQGNGKLQGVTIYNTELTAARVTLHDTAGRAVHPGLH